MVTENGLIKMAILLNAMKPDKVEKILGSFNNEEKELIKKKMSETKNIDKGKKNQICDEFIESATQLLAKGRK